MVKQVRVVQEYDGYQILLKRSNGTYRTEIAQLKNHREVFQALETLITDERIDPLPWISWEI